MNARLRLQEGQKEVLAPFSSHFLFVFFAFHVVKAFKAHRDNVR